MTEPLLGPCGLNPTLSRVQWEDAVMLEAEYFTSIDFRSMGQSLNVGVQYPTLTAAVEVAKGHTKPMVYAVHKSGRSVHVSPADYDRMIAARKEA
jgi:hypothetical protein